MAGRVGPLLVVLSSAIVAACVPGGVVVPAPSIPDHVSSVVLVERLEGEEPRPVRAELFGLRADAPPEPRFSAESELVWLLYEETPEELGLRAGPLAPADLASNSLAPHQAVQYEPSELDWRALEVSELPTWTLPHRLTLPCRAARQERDHSFDQFWLEFRPPAGSGLLPAITSMVALDDTRALVATMSGRFYRLQWPDGGPVELLAVESSTTGYQFASFRQGDTIYLGGTGARVAEVSIGPLLRDPPQLELDEELLLADRSPTITDAVVSITGDPSGARDLFFMTEATEVFHLGPAGVTELGAMNHRRPRFDPARDRELRARMVSWIDAGRAVAAWFFDPDDDSDPGPTLLTSSGERTPLPLPERASESFLSPTSVAFDPELGLYAASSAFGGGGTRGEIFRRRRLDEPWSSVAVVDFAIHQLLPSRSAVFTTGGYFYGFEWVGAVVRAHRGYHFEERAEHERCLWLRGSGRQRLAIRLGAGRFVSTGTTMGDDSPRVFTHEE